MQAFERRPEGGTTPELSHASAGQRPPSDPLVDTVPWIPDDDPTLNQLRAWRDQLNSDSIETRQPLSGAPNAADSAPPGSGPEPASNVGAHAVVKHAGAGDDDLPSTTSGERRGAPTRRGGAAAAGGRRHRRVGPAESPSTGAWVIPGFSRTRPEPSTIDVSAPAVERPLPSRHRAGWDVSGQKEQNPPAPIESREEFVAAQLATTAFPSLDLVPVGENVDLEIAIEANGLRKKFRDFTAVDGVSFQVPKGRIVAILGPNGAGKTTTVNMLCTLLAPDGGSASVAGHDVQREAPAVRRAITLTGQFAALDEQLTGRENLVMFGRLLGLTKKKAQVRAGELLEFFGLESAASRKVREYSGGMRRRIDIACGMVTRPEVVFLDEPTTGLDPRSRQDVWAFVEQLRALGVTILLTTQYLEEADMLADRIVVIDKGKVIAEGTSDELKAATGAAYCEVTPVHPAYVHRLRAALGDLLGPTAAEFDVPPDGTVSVPAPNGPATLAEVLKRAEQDQIPLADVVLRRPSLDEVFLSLTDPDAAGADSTPAGDGR
ncbi:ATP-binding cassette domain-containing protein [Gordonia sp. (in: high G+C Gram-positive bacteria)]|uniref:ATP-binding cassette domain-containing protein n=1 Tax=unclassified Gordonia (in: high G+C Gram-positive bacteria) TaxID=2657482 RepID=UPI0026053FFA|nr:ATP-binding cassette domain-containing protein [Gordonia sp. (in: high G+C Gram-positive bacteria)]